LFPVVGAYFRVLSGLGSEFPVNQFFLPLAALLLYLLIRFETESRTAAAASSLFFYFNREIQHLSTRYMTEVFAAFLLFF